MKRARALRQDHRTEYGSNRFHPPIYKSRCDLLAVCNNNILGDVDMTCLEEELRAESDASCDSDVPPSSLASFNRASSSSRSPILSESRRCACHINCCPSKMRRDIIKLGGRGSCILEVVIRKM